MQDAVRREGDGETHCLGQFNTSVSLSARARELLSICSVGGRLADSSLDHGEGNRVAQGRTGQDRQDAQCVERNQ